MPYADKKQEKEYNRQWKVKNKEKRKLQKKTHTRISSQNQKTHVRIQ